MVNLALKKRWVLKRIVPVDDPSASNKCIEHFSIQLSSSVKRITGVLILSNNNLAQGFYSWGNINLWANNKKDHFFSGEVRPRNISNTDRKNIFFKTDVTVQHNRVDGSFFVTGTRFSNVERNIPTVITLYLEVEQEI